MMTYPKFQKIPRLDREAVVTEKLDGTNALVYIRPVDLGMVPEDVFIQSNVGNYYVRAGSRTRWLAAGPTPQDPDNFGFARWVHDNAERLVNLGPGLHYGEWWGRGIQRGYGLPTRRFSLFDPHRYMGADPLLFDPAAFRDRTGCHLVPILYEGPFSTIQAVHMLNELGEEGSIAAPGFDRPEGVVVHHLDSGVRFKKTFSDTHKDRGTNRPRFVSTITEES